MSNRLRVALPVLAVALPAVVLTAALVPTTSPTATAAAKRKYTTQQVFEGLLFGTGPAASLFPEMWRTSPRPAAKPAKAAAEALREGAASLRKDELVDEKAAAKLTELAGDIASGKGTRRRLVSREKLASYTYHAIAKKEPAYFDHFREEISSGDQRRVQLAVTDVSKRVIAEVSGDPVVNPGDTVGSDVAVNQDVLVNENALLNINVAVNVDTVVNVTSFWSKNFVTEASRLRSETVINQVTKELTGVEIVAGGM